MMCRVYLNVGGTAFETYQETLTQLPYFQGMLNVEKQIVSSENKPIFIDRDPKMFRHILNFLRDHNYEIPEKYYGELDFWGLQVKDLQQPKDTLITTIPQSIHESNNPETNLSKSIYNHCNDYFRNDPYLTTHVSVFKKSTLCQYFPQRKMFVTSNWNYCLPDNVVIRNVFILIPKQVSLTELKHFDISIKIGDNYFVSHSLEVAPYYYTEIKVYCGYHIIPLYFLLNHNNCFITTGLKVILSLVTSKYASIHTGLTMSTTCISDKELHITTQWQRDFSSGQIHELDIKQSHVILQPGYLRYLIWKTDQLVNTVILVNRSTESSVQYDMIDFCYLERYRVKKSELADGWGAIYICLEPDEFTMDTGGLIVDNMELVFKSNDKREITGKLWQFGFDVRRGTNIDYYSMLEKLIKDSSKTESAPSKDD